MNALQADTRNDLITRPANDGAFDVVPSMSSHEIAELTGKEHKNVLADIRKMLLELGKAAADFSAAATVPGPNGSRRRIDIFNLPKRETLVLVSGYSIAMRAKIIDRWQELEAASAAPALPNFADPVAAARAWADQFEAARALEGQVAKMQPQVDALHLIAATEKELTLTDAAKHLQVKPGVFYTWLHVLGWTYRRTEHGAWIAHQPAIDAGRLVHRVTAPTERNGLSEAKFQVRVTPKGLARLGLLIMKGQGPQK